MNTPSLRATRSNRLLAALPKTALERIIPDLDLKPFAMQQVVQPRREPLAEVVFPLLGVASMISMGDSGDSVEVATIGCEGMVGLPLFLGGQHAAVEVFIQVPGEGLHLSAKAFHYHLEKEKELVQILLRYTQALLTQPRRRAPQMRQADRRDERSRAAEDRGHLPSRDGELCRGPVARSAARGTRAGARAEVAGTVARSTRRKPASSTAMRLMLALHGDLGGRTAAASPFTHASRRARRDRGPLEGTHGGAQPGASIVDAVVNAAEPRGARRSPAGRRVSRPSGPHQHLAEGRYSPASASPPFAPDLSRAGGRRPRHPSHHRSRRPHALRARRRLDGEAEIY